MWLLYTLYVFDVLFSFVILFVLGIVVTAVYHIFLRVPYVPTPKQIVSEMVRVAELKDGDIVYDLGAGDARLLIEAKKACPGLVARGCELVPTIWCWGKICVWFSGMKVDLQLRSILRQDVADADVVFLYLFPNLMAALGEKFDRELRPGTRVVSHTFKFPGRSPKREVKIPWGRGEKTVRIYEW